jgi:predicted negative regulator of RcsB-dependent stress response
MSAGDAHAWSDLSSKMQAVPSLKAYGLSMKGDVLWAQGDVAAATDAYQKASSIQPTPWTDKKLEAVKMHEVKQSH